MNDEFSIDWGNLTLIPEGNYEATYVGHETIHKSFGPKVKITFRIVSIGEYFGTLIDAWYNAKTLQSAPGRNRKATLSRHSKLATELLKVLDVKERIGRLSPVQLKGLIIEVKVRTVKTDSKQKSYSAIQRYSTVDYMVRCLTSNHVGTVKPLPKPPPEPIPTSKPVGSINISIAGDVLANA
jgi:hypothetical protein